MSGGTISGNTASAHNESYGGGVYVQSGTFTMSGGTISGNTASGVSSAYGGGVCIGNNGILLGSGTFTMLGGNISGNTVSISSSDSSYAWGGGVWVYTYGQTFTKTNGVITGYGDDTINGNKVMNSSGVIQGNGHAVNAVSSSVKRLEKTVTASHNLDSSQSGAAGGWVE
jgi:hypothetical protein